jgi:hypothetical protein
LKLTHQSDAQVLRLFLDRNSLEKLYFGFIRPILEYGSVVWDNCTREQPDLIESVQYESARIVTGLRKGTSRVKLYGELGWDSLQNRRKKQKLADSYCTDSIRSDCSLVQLSQTTLPYSSICLIKPK